MTVIVAHHARSRYADRPGVLQTFPRGAQSLQINSSAAVVQAALNGQGVALARRAFVGDELRAGRLMRLLPSVRWPIRWAYYVVRPEFGVPREPVQAFVDWLNEEAEADLGAPGSADNGRRGVAGAAVGEAGTNSAAQARRHR